MGERSAARFLLGLGPTVAQRHRAIEDWLAWFGIDAVHAEVAQPLELPLTAGRRLCEARFEQRLRHDFQRVRIERRLPIDSVRDIVWIGLSAKVIVQPHLGWDGVLGLDPMQRRFHLAAVGRVAAARSRVVGATQFDNVAAGVFHDLLASDEVGVSQTDFTART